MNDLGHHQYSAYLRKEFKQLIDGRGESLYKLCAKSGIVKRQSIYDWIDGRCLPSERKLSALLDAMQTDQKTREKLLLLRSMAKEKKGNGRRGSRYPKYRLKKGNNES